VISELGRDLRPIAKGVIASVCYPAAAIALRKLQPFIVSYHRVVEHFASSAQSSLPGMLVSRSMFERQLDWLGRHFRLVSLDEIGKRLESGEPFEQPVAAITFDDGYRDVYEHACPVLLRKGIPATFFVVTELVGQASWQIYDRLYHVLTQGFAAWSAPNDRLNQVLKSLAVGGRDGLTTAVARHPADWTAKLLTLLSQGDVLRVIGALEAQMKDRAVEIPPLLNWDHITALRRAGFTFGSHTKTHVWLSQERPERVADELVGSKLELERRLGEPVLHFAYPAGCFAPHVVQAVAEAGYPYAYTICRHRSAAHPRLSIPREVLWEHSATDSAGRFAAAIIGCQTRGLFSASRKCVQTHA